MPQEGVITRSAELFETVTVEVEEVEGSSARAIDGEEVFPNASPALKSAAVVKFFERMVVSTKHQRSLLLHFLPFRPNKNCERLGSS